MYEQEKWKLRAATAKRERLPVERVDLVPFPVSVKSTGRVKRSRKEALREHLRKQLSATPSPPVDTSADDPIPHSPALEQNVCARCRGRCCANGDDHAYLTPRTLDRVRHDRPALDGEALIDAYLECVPARTYKGSCIFHGARGCALPRELRSDTCIRYYCGSLRRTLDVVAAEGGRAVIAVFEHPFRPPRTLLARAPQPAAECPDQARAATPAATSSAGS